MPGHYHHSDSVVEIVLTFDDGPHTGALNKHPVENRTESVIDVLRINRTSPKIKAIFFIQTHSRSKIEDKYFRGNTDMGKELIRRMHASGHIIGVHTGHDVKEADHIPHTDRTARELGDDIDRASNFIEAVLATPLKGKPYLPKLIRPVGTPTVPKEIKQIYYDKYHKLTGWDVDSEDSFLGATPGSVKKALVEHTITAVKAGKRKLIVLFHDTNKYTYIRENLEDYIKIISDTIEGKIGAMIGGRFVKLEGLWPVFVNDRNRVEEIVRWKYWSGQDAGWSSG